MSVYKSPSLESQNLSLISWKDLGFVSNVDLTNNIYTKTKDYLESYEEPEYEWTVNGISVGTLGAAIAVVVALKLLFCCLYYCRKHNKSRPVAEPGVTIGLEYI